MKQNQAPKNTRGNLTNFFLTGKHIKGSNVLCVGKTELSTDYFWLVEDRKYFWIANNDIGMWRLTKLNGKQILKSKIK